MIEKSVGGVKLSCAPAPGSDQCDATVGIWLLSSYSTRHARGASFHVGGCCQSATCSARSAAHADHHHQIPRPDGADYRRMTAEELPLTLTSPCARWQRNLFPDCSYKAPCNGWVVCDNCFGKSIGRTRDIVQVRGHQTWCGAGWVPMQRSLRWGRTGLPADILRWRWPTVHGSADLSELGVQAAVQTCMTLRVAHAWLCG